MTTTAEKAAKNEGVDRLGAIASGLCAIHCAVCALLPAAFGALGLGFLVGHTTEWIFTGVAIVFAGVALVMGWRQHRSRVVAAVLAVGIMGLLASRVIEMSGEHHHDHAAESGHVAHGEADAHAGEHADHGHDDHHAEAAHHDKGHAEHGHEAGEVSMAHMAGTAVGVLAGLMLFLGHMLNIRASRRCREACCD
ncbi:MAG: MerC domain-containing protein [Bradymonadia bacterium]